MTIGNIGDNFRAIYRATHHDPNPLNSGKICPVELYAYMAPNFFPPPEDVNFRPFLNGLFHSYMSRYLIIDAVRYALEQVHAKFHECQKRLLADDLPKMKSYLKAVSKLKTGEPFREDEYVKTRDNILDFWMFTHKFLKSIHDPNDPNARMRQIFETHFCQKCFYHIEPLEQMQAIIALQGMFGQTLPLKALIEAAFGNGGTDSLLDDFVKKLKTNEVPFNILHYALKAVVDYAIVSKRTQDDIESENFPTLSKLELALDAIDNKLFFCKNESHLVWRDSLKPNSEIASITYAYKNGQQFATRYRFILGEQIGKKFEGFDNHIYYSIQECYISEKKFSNENINELKYEPLINFNEVPEKREADIETNNVIWITINEALPGIRKEKTCLYNEVYLNDYGINVSEIQFVDNKGRFALVEKLHENNSAFLKLIPQLIKSAIREVDEAPTTLEPLYLPQKFMFDKENCLKTTKFIKPAKEFSVNTWEQFIYKIVKGNKSQFKKIMNESTLNEMEESKFIRVTVLASFNEDKGNPEEKCIKQIFKDKNVLALAKNLQGKIIELREQCIKALEFEYGSIVSSAEVTKLLLDHYMATEASSILWPSLQSEVISAYALKHTKT